MKNALIELLAIGLVLTLAGCSSKDVASSNEASTETTVTSAVTTTPAVTQSEKPTTTTTEPIITEPIVEDKETSKDMFIWEGTKITGLTKEGKELTTIIIPDGTTEISSESVETKGFRASKVQRLVIPDSVEKIDDSTFRYCKYLEKVEIGEHSKLKEYDDWFVSDHKIQELVFPEGMTNINTPLHINAINLVIIPSTVTVMPDCLFDFDSYSANKELDMKITDKVEVFTFGDNLNTIGSYDSRQYIEQIIENKDKDLASKQLFETLQKMLMPNYDTADTTGFSVILHCDKDSLWDQIFRDAAWVTIEYNEVPETLDSETEESSLAEENNA